MKVIVAAVVLAVLGFIVAGCTTAQQDTAQAALANANKTNLLALQAIKNGCAIVQPTLVAAGAASPQVATAAAANGVICGVAGVAAEAASAAVAAQAPTPASAVAGK